MFAEGDPVYQVIHPPVIRLLKHRGFFFHLFRYFVLRPGGIHLRVGHEHALLHVPCGEVEGVGRAFPHRPLRSEEVGLVGEPSPAMRADERVPERVGPVSLHLLYHLHPVKKLMAHYSLVVVPYGDLLDLALVGHDLVGEVVLHVTLVRHHVPRIALVAKDVEQPRRCPPRSLRALYPLPVQLVAQALCGDAFLVLPVYPADDLRLALHYHERRVPGFLISVDGGPWGVAVYRAEPESFLDPL